MSTGSAEMDTKELRKLIEDKANDAIERIQTYRDTYRREMAECKQFVIDKVSTFFADLEARSQKQEIMDDEIIQGLIVELMEQLENIDTLLSEIHMCRDTLSKLNEMLTGKDAFN
ncbi:unnamed protein product [Schistosoma margrebowiei]|uniref:Uncharacterized protein n=1 Tax=Schistosoma margrebowiei TaxID=48269 RepID=A0AA84Z6B0_9TREM|nr:unnamed protein product [Schistosoma margrebowiei]